MFPLSTVLLPGMVLPLQVFEPRYRTLMERCMAADRRFGVTLIERGNEVGGGDVRTMVGTVAEVVQADQEPDGRWALVAVGTDRFRVRRWLADEPYPRAETDLWPDETDDTAPRLSGHVAECGAHLRRIMGLSEELGHPTGPVPELDGDPRIASYQLALLAPLATLDRQHLLAQPGPGGRLTLLDRMLLDLVQDLESLRSNRPDI